MYIRVKHDMIAVPTLLHARGGMLHGIGYGVTQSESGTFSVPLDTSDSFITIPMFRPSPLWGDEVEEMSESN